MNVLIKALVVIFLSLSYNAGTLLAKSPLEEEGKLTWSKLSRLEKKMESWAKKVTDKEIIKIGKMHQRPPEVEVIRAYFPYLLPEGFFSQKMDMSCYPSFEEFKKKKDLTSYNAWSKCLRILYRKSIPELSQKALKDLKP